MMRQYSIVFLPPSGHNAFVKSKKDSLANIIGWYNSRNSIAHITVLEFVIEESRIDEVLAYLEHFCNEVAPFTVKFNCLGVLGRAFCFAPSIRSRNFLSAIMKALSAKFPFDSFGSANPHMTIGRRLYGMEFNAAKRLFASENPDFSFEVDALFLRRLSEERGQYDIISRVAFGGNNELMSRFSVQTALFD